MLYQIADNDSCFQLFILNQTIENAATTVGWICNLKRKNLKKNKIKV